MIMVPKKQNIRLVFFCNNINHNIVCNNLEFTMLFLKQKQEDWTLDVIFENNAPSEQYTCLSKVTIYILCWARSVIFRYYKNFNILFIYNLSWI